MVNGVIYLYLGTAGAIHTRVPLVRLGPEYAREH